MAQDTIFSLKYRIYHSTYDEDYYTGPLDIFNHYSKYNYTISAGVKLSYNFFDFYADAEVQSRFLSIRYYNESGAHSNGPAGSFYSYRNWTKINYSAQKYALILKAGSDLKIGLFARRMAIIGGFNIGFSGQIYSREETNEYESGSSTTTYNGNTNTYSGNSNVSNDLATNHLKYNENIVFSDIYFGLASNKGKFRFRLLAGYREYFDFVYKYAEHRYARDRFWELSVGYRL